MLFSGLLTRSSWIERDRAWATDSRSMLMKLRFTFQSWRRSLKRLLPLLFLLSWVAVLLVGSPTSASVQLPRQEIRGVWMTSHDFDILMDREKVRDAVSQLARLNLNTIYPVVWNSGYVLYESAVAQQMGIQPFVRKGIQGHDLIGELIAQAHQQGLLVIPWFEFGFMAPPTSELTLKHPDWITQRRDGSQNWVGAAGEVVWLNPFRPEVQQLIIDLVLEAIARYDLDGIQFDDHASLPNEFGYDKYTIDLYIKETKKHPPANPQDSAWVRWRADKITAFMVKLHHAVKARKPEAIFSIAPNYYDYAYKAHLQDWLTWVRQNIADELIVQVYRPDIPSFLAQVVRPELQATQQKIPTGVGILTGLRTQPVSMQLIQNKVRVAKEHRLGVAFFFYESLWDYAPESKTERQARFQSLFPFPARRVAAANYSGAGSGDK